MGTDPIFSFAKMGSVPIFLLFFIALAARAEERVLQLENGETITYSMVTDAQASARPTAEQILRHLAAGEIEDAALLSNAPRQRYEVLKNYRASVGEEEFKRVYGQYSFPENRIVAEIAIGAHRLVIWDLGEAGHRLVGQYYVDVEGRFLMDDVPGEQRSRLRQVLETYRAGKIKK